MSEKWCEHISHDEKHHAFNISIPISEGAAHFQRSETWWKVCPLCGAPRPDEPKRLSEIFSKMSTATGIGSCGMSNEGKGKLLEKVALEWFLGVVDSIPIGNKYGEAQYALSGPFKVALKAALERKSDGQ